MTKDRETSSRQYQLVCGDAAEMDLIRTGEADLVLGSPPYFPAELESELTGKRNKGPVSDQVEPAILRFARGLQPVFAEIARILRPGRPAILQTRDIRYAGFLIPLVDTHREMMEAEGLRLVTRILWQKRIRPSADKARLERSRSVGGFRNQDLEEFLVFAASGKLDQSASAASLAEEEIAACQEAVWRLPGAERWRTHPHQSPPAVLRRLVALFSEPDDLVVDPFLGHGTTLRIALELGRRGIGYELDPSYAAEADQLLEKRL